MNTLEFDSLQPGVSGKGTEAAGSLLSRPLSVKDLEAVFEALEEEIFLIDRPSGEILWMSPCCTTLTHKLGASRNIGEFPALKAMVYSALSNEGASSLHSRWYSDDSTWQQYIGSNEKSAISVYVTQTDVEKAWVRLSRYSDRDDYFRQYVAEQEALFNTSRTVSVGEVATTLAHELNQPLGTLLNIVNGMKSRISSNTLDSDELYKALEIAEKQAHFASEILLRVRSFAQARKPAFGPCDVNLLIDNTLKLLDWKFHAESVNVRYVAEDDNLTVRGDRTLLQQVLVNLLHNAVESMAEVEPPGKVIRIRCASQGTLVRLEISDTGRGINVSRMDDLFTLFRSSKPNGMGVGLNMCLSFIELHQGKFWFTRNDRQGSTAHVLLPE